MSWSFFFAAVMRIAILRSLCVDVCGRKLGSLLLHCFTENPQDEEEITAQSNVGGCFGARARVCIVLFYCRVSAAHMCVQALNFSFQIFIQYHRGLHGGFQSPDEKGGCGCRSVAL